MAKSHWTDDVTLTPHQIEVSIHAEAVGLAVARKLYPGAPVDDAEAYALIRIADRPVHDTLLSEAWDNTCTRMNYSKDDHEAGWPLCVDYYYDYMTGAGPRDPDTN